MDCQRRLRSSIPVLPEHRGVDPAPRRARRRPEAGDVPFDHPRTVPYRRFQRQLVCARKEQAGGWGMVYVVRAINVDGVTGTFTAEKNTRREAVELAKSLREHGLWVIIIGPDGKPLDETKEDQ
jgi:hypothetical protein